MNKSGNFNKFLVIWVGEMIASIGSGMSAFGLGVYVFEMTRSAADVSMVTLCAFLPAVLLNPVAGVLADRFDRRLLMILGDSLSAVGLVIMLVLMNMGPVEVWQICACVAFSSIFVALLEPSYRASITDLLSADEYGKASGLVQLASSTKYLISPVIAGFLLIAADVRLLILIDIATLLITVTTILLVRKTLERTEKKSKSSSFAHEFLEGCKYLLSNRSVMVLMLLISAITYYMGALQTLFTPMILSFSDAKTLGIIESVGATGMLVSSLLIGIFSLNRKYVKTMVAGLALAGLLIALIGTTTNLIVIPIIAFLFFATLPPVNSSIEVLMRKSIPNETQGRIWGLVSFISQIGYIVAYASTGILADKVFIPLLSEGGALAGSLGALVGVGPARGIGLQLLISGITVIVLAVVISRVKSIRRMEALVQQ